MKQKRGFRIAVVAILIAIGVVFVLKKSLRKNASQTSQTLSQNEDITEVDSKIESKTPETSLSEPAASPQKEMPQPHSQALMPTPPQPREQQMSDIQIRFAEQLSLLERNLPTREMMKHKTFEEVHDTPQEVLDAGARLAQLKEAWLNNPELKPQARAFYQTCAHQIQYLASVRSLCLANARSLNQELHLEKMDEGTIPQNIKNIADQIPN